MWQCYNKTLFTKTGSGLAVATAYRPSSGAEWEGADRSAAEAEVSQGCRGEVLLHRVELCGCRMAGRVGSDPRSRPELPDNTKGRPRGWQKAQRGRCRRQEAEPTAEVQTSPEEQQVPEEGWGRPVQFSSARPRALHPQAVLLRQDTHRANFKRQRIRPQQMATGVSEQAQQRHLLLKLGISLRT